MSASDALVIDATKRARSRANHRIAFAGHAVIYLATNCLLAVLFFPAAVIVGLAWGIGLAAHGFFGVIAPLLRDRWTEREIARVIPAVRLTERRASDGRHARDVARIAASLAHEIRNPIAAAKSLVQQIAEDPQSTENAEYAKVAGAELDRVEASIAHLLRFAREEPLETAEVTMNHVVDRAVGAVRGNVAGIRLETDVPPLAFEADEDKIHRVLVNLLANAADAVREMPERRRVICVNAGTSLDGADAWVRVRDCGPGIEPTVRDRIFDPWVTTKASGNGLGMAIARKLCEAHGGRLEIEETSADGTAMLVTLPRRGAEPRRRSS